MTLAGENGNVALGDVSTKSHSGDTITATLNATQRTAVGDAMTLSVSEGAVVDQSGSRIAGTTVTVAVTDGIQPTLASSHYNTGTGILSITFSEPLNHTATDYSGLAVVGQLANVTLDRVAAKTADTSTIRATLDATQMETAGTAPTLVISEGAVVDMAGNGIVGTTGTIDTVRHIPENDFVTVWETTSANDAVTIPVGDSEATYTIDWGDGTIDRDVTGNQTRTYAEAGNYTVRISGDFERIYLGGNSTNAAKLQSIEQWGTVKWRSMAGAFQDAANLRYNATDTPDLAKVANMSGMFHSAASFNGDISSWNVSQVTDMSYMFDTARAFNQPLNSWDVSGVTDMSEMFNTALAFNQPLNSWDVSGVTDMSYMFSRAIAFNQPLNSWNVSQVTDMSNTFSSTVAFNQPLNNWDVSGVTDMAAMFASARAFNQPLNSWNVSQVTDMTAMFSSATAFNQPLDNWDVSGATDMSFMFVRATAFNQPLNSWDVSGVTDMPRMFTAARAFNQPLNNWDVSGVTDMTAMFSGASSFEQNLGDWYITLDSTVIDADDAPGTVANITAQNQFLSNMMPTYGIGTSDDQASFVVSDKKLNMTITPTGTSYIVNITSSASGEFGTNNHRLYTIAVTDGIPPTVSSASYDVNTGNLTITFSEPLSPDRITYDRIRVASQTGGSTTLNLAAARSHSGDVINATLTTDQRAVVREYPVLFLDNYAVYDLAGNWIAPTTSDIAVIDTVPPAVLSSSYNTESGVLSVTFDELLNRTLTSYSGLAVRGQSGSLTFDDAYRVVTTHDTVWATLNQTQREAVGEPATVSVSAGAVTDLYGNRVVQATITPTVTTPGLPFIAIREAAALQDSSSVMLDRPWDMGLFEAGGSTYGVVTVLNDDLIHIVDLTDPANPNIVASLIDPAYKFLNGASYLDMFDRGGSPYAVVSGPLDSGIQVVSVANPSAPRALGGVHTDGANGLSVFWIAGTPYAAVAPSLDRLWIVDITRVHQPVRDGYLSDTDSILLRSPRHVDTFTSYDRAYAVVTPSHSQEYGIQIVDITDPANPTPAGHLRDNATTKIGTSRPDMFEAAGRTYVLAGSSSSGDGGIQAVDITDPDNPVPSGLLAGDARIHSVDVLKSGGRIWALAATDAGIMMVDITDPANPAHTGGGDIGQTLWIKAFEADGRTWAAVGNNTALRIVQLLTGADIPVNLVAATYHTFDMDLAMTFDIEVNGTATDLSLLGIRDAGGDDNLVSLADSTAVAVNRTVTVTLDGPAAASVSEMAEPTLVMDEGAIASTYGNPIAAGNHTITVLDVFPPTISSASYNTDGFLALEFSEPLNHTATDYAGLIISGQHGSVPLDQVAAKTTNINTIRATLNATQMETVGTAPTLAISEGAVSDLVGNGIAGTAQTIEVTILGPPIVEIRPIANITDNTNTVLDDAVAVDLFKIGGRAYAIVAAFADDGVQIINLTDPASPATISSVTDGAGGFDELDGAGGVTTFTIAGRTYAAVTAYVDDGVQIMNLTNPASPATISSVTDGAGGFDELDAAWGVDTFTIAGRTYAVVAAYTDDGVQIINLTDPASPAAVSSVTDGAGGFDELDGVAGVDTFTIAGRTYAVVAAQTDDGIQVIDLTNPASPAAVSSVTDGVDGFDGLDGATGVATFTIAGRTYAAVAANTDDSVQIIDLTDPASPVPVIHIKDSRFRAITEYTVLDGANDVSVFTTGNRTYAVVTANTNDGVQVIDLTVPSLPSSITSLTDTPLTELDGPWEVDTITIGGRIYAAAVTGFAGDGIQILRLLTEMDAPPKFASATYNTTSSTLSVTFDKDLNGAATDYSLLHVRDLNRDAGGVTLASSTSKTAAGQTLTVTLDGATAMTVNAMTDPQLDIDPGAVTDTDGNQIEAAADQPIDTIRPDFVIYPISSLVDGAMDEPSDVAHFDVDGRHYAIVTAQDDDGDGIHIINVTDPYRPYLVAALYDNATLILDNPADPDTFQVGGRTYAAVTALNTTDNDRGIQIIDLTDPAAPAPVSQFDPPGDDVYDVRDVHAYRSGGDTYLMAVGNQHYARGDYAWAFNVTDPANLAQLDTVARNARNTVLVDGHSFETGGHTYWSVISSPSRDRDRLYVINATDPTDLRYVPGSNEVYPAHTLDVFEAGGLPYALTVGTSSLTGRIHVFNLTDPASLSETHSGSTFEHITDADIFELDGRTYALVTLFQDHAGPHKVAVYDVSNPANMRLAGVLDDTAHTLLTRAHVDTFIGPDGHTYALAADRTEGGLQVLRLDADGMDDAPPTFLEASYRYDGLVTITFSEPLGSNVNYGLLHVRDAGQDTGGVRLDISANRMVSGDTITMTVNQTFQEVIEKMGLPQLDIGSGAVADIAGNPVRGLDDLPLSLVRFTISQLSEAALGLDLLIYESGGHPYVAGYFLDDKDLSLQIRNVSDPAAPVSVGDVDANLTPSPYYPPHPYGLDYFVQDGSSYLAGVVFDRNDYLAVYDVTNPSNPTAAGTLMYLSDSRNLRMFDVSVYSLAGERYAVLPSGNVDGVVRIANITDPDNPTRVSEFAKRDDTYHLKSPLAVDTFVVGERAYAAVCSTWFGDLQILDVTDPSNPVSAAIYYPTGQSGSCSDVKALTLGGGPWLAVCGSGLHMLDMSDPAAPAPASRFRGTFASPFVCSDISPMQADGRTYLVTSGVQVVDVSNPYRPEQVASLPTSYSDIDVFEAGGSAYAVHTRSVLGLVPYPPGDDAPPTVTGAVYNPDSDTIWMNFSEPVAFPVNSALFHIRDENQGSGGVTLSGSPPIKGSFTTFQLDAAGAAALDMMSSVQLDVDAGAVSDLAGNPIAAIADIPVGIEDPIPPSLVQATYTVSTRTLNATFHEPLNGTLNVGLLNVRDTGDPYNVEVSLSEATLDRVAGHSVYFVLDAHQAVTLGRMNVPQLDVDAGAVFDVFGNPARAVADLDITVVDGVPPAALSAAYYRDKGVLRITFSEPLSNMTQQGLLHVRERGESSGGVTADSASIRGHSIYLNYSATKQTAILSMADATLDIGAGAVTDRHGQPVAAAQDLPLAIIQFDTTSVSSMGQGRYSGMDAFEIGDATYLAASAHTNGIRVINVTDPASPAIAGNSTGLSTNYDSPVAVFAAGGSTYAVSTEGSTIHMVDVTDPTSPTPVGNVTAIYTVTDIDVFEAGGRVWAAVTTYDRAEASPRNSIQIFDVTDPASPAVAGNITNSYNIDLRYHPLAQIRSLDIFEADGRTYAVGLGYRGMLVANVTDPNNPEELALARWNYISRSVGSVETFVSGDNRIYALALHGIGGGATVFDITNPAKPVRVAEMPSTDDPLLASPRAASILTADGRTYALIGSDTNHSDRRGVLVVDLTYPHDPYYLSGVSRVYVSNIEVFVADGRAHMALTHHSSIYLRLAGPATAIDDAPPTLHPDRAVYHPPSGDLPATLTLSFDGPTNGTIRTEHLGVRDALSDNATTLAGASVTVHDLSEILGEPLAALIYEVQLDPEVAALVEGAAEPVLDIDPGAVYGLAGNPAGSVLGYPITVPDVTPPEVASAVFETDPSLLSITFSEPLNHTATNYDAVTILGESANVTLAHIDQPTAVNGTIGVHLNATHLETLGGAPIHLDVAADAVSDMAGNPIIAATVPVTTPDVTPPEVSSATFETDTGLLAITFTETINHTATNYDAVTLLGASSNITLDRIDGLAATNGTISAALNATHLETLGGAPIHLDVAADAVSDMAGNHIAAATVPVTTPDVTPPEVSSATFETDTGLLAITFTETINHTATNYDAVTLLGASSNITLDRIDGLAATNGTISAALNATHLETLGGAPAHLDVAADAVSDMAGNPIIAATVPVTTPDVTPPEVSSATLEMQSGLLTITFTETINHTATNYDAVTILGESANLTLAHIDQPTAVNGTIEVRLNATHLETLGGTPDALSVGQAAVVDAANNPISAAVVPIVIQDTTPPEAASAVFETDLGLLTITFTEVIDHAATKYDTMTILGESANLTLAETEWLPLEETLTIVLNQTQLDGMGAPQHISIPSGAVSDMSGNPIIAATVPVAIPDTIPPEISSATFEQGTGLLSITFTEPLDHAATKYDTVTVLGTSSNITLDRIDGLAATNGTISAALNATHLETLGGAPRAPGCRRGRRI